MGRALFYNVPVHTALCGALIVKQYLKNKDPGCIWKRLHSFESNRKFIQLFLNILDEMVSYRFLLVSACIQLMLFTAFDMYRSPNATNEQHLKCDPLVFCGMKIELSTSPVSRKASK